MASDTHAGTNRSALTDLAQRLVIPGWYLLAAFALAVLLGSLPGYLLQIQDGALLHRVDAPAGLTFALNLVSALASLVAALVSLWLGVLLFRQRGANRMALFLSAFLIGYGIVMAGPLEALAALIGQTDLVLGVQGLIAPFLILLLFLFPSGTFVPVWSRWLAPITLLLAPVIVLISFNFPASLQSVWGVVGSTAIVGLLLTGLYAQAFRYRRVSTPEERQRTKWAVYGLTLWILLVAASTGPYAQIISAPPGTLLPWWVPLSSVGWWLALTIIPISFTIAILRYQLFDINLLINRTLVYVGMTVGVVGLYVVMVGAASTLFQARGSLAVSLLATGLIAVLFQPLRERLQHGVNRLLYGDRDDPYAVLSGLSRQLETAVSPETMLPNIVATIARTLKLPYAGITLVGDEQPINYGRSTGKTLTLRLTYQDAHIGHLHLAHRAPDEPFTPGERRLLEDIARQTGVAAHAVRLTADLQRSRERLVTTREEERRRLRRDLHDGLGPALASLMLQVESARDLVTTDPQQARHLLTDIIDQAEAAVKDVRRLVYNLRPPALDELGLLGALGQLVDNLSSNRLSIRLETPDRLPPLSAAVEVAAYRIVQEALTNVVRHAEAGTCVVSIRLDRGNFFVTITDDGRGLADGDATGVGLYSMRERAAELSGNLTITSSPAGTTVIARLPLPRDNQENPA